MFIFLSNKAYANVVISDSSHCLNPGFPKFSISGPTHTSIIHLKTHQNKLTSSVDISFHIQYISHAYTHIGYIIYIYSQVHKYWDIDTILTFLALYTTTMDFKWNEQYVL